MLVVCLVEKRKDVGEKRKNVVVENVNDEETNSAKAKSINTTSNRSI